SRPAAPGGYPRDERADLAGRRRAPRANAEKLVGSQPVPPQPVRREGPADRRAGRCVGYRRNHNSGDGRSVPDIHRGREEDRSGRRSRHHPPRVSSRPECVQGQASRGRGSREAAAPRTVHEPRRDLQAPRVQVRGDPMKAIVASGKRKTAVARATLTKGRGVVRINSVPVEIYPFELGRLKILEPLKLAGKKVDTIDIDVNVQGGGVMGQADAVRTAIARGLVQYLNDNDLETVFREYDRTLIVPDTRRKLPKKPLGRGARKKRQKSYR